jgi:putative peptidoglycan lipid II flippase
MFLIRLAGALLLMAGVALWLAGYIDWVAMRAAPLHRVAALVGILSACGVVYFGALLAMGFRFRDFKRIAR